MLTIMRLQFIYGEVHIECDHSGEYIITYIYKNYINFIILSTIVYKNKWNLLYAHIIRDIEWNFVIYSSLCT